MFFLLSNYHFCHGKPLHRHFPRGLEQSKCPPLRAHEGGPPGREGLVQSLQNTFKSLRLKLAFSHAWKLLATLVPICSTAPSKKKKLVGRYALKSAQQPLQKKKSLGRFTILVDCTFSAASSVDCRFSLPV